MVDQAIPLSERFRDFAINGGDIADVQQFVDTIDRMQAWIEFDCRCPCCEEVRECVDGCTFGADDPFGHERMAGAREVLFGSGSVS